MLVFYLLNKLVPCDFTITERSTFASEFYWQVEARYYQDLETYPIQPLIQIPTLHVHGLRDPGLEYHQDLLKECFDLSYTRLVEWDGEHRVPIKTKDVATVTGAIFAMAFDVGICLD